MECLLGNFCAFCHLLIFSKSTFLKKYFMNTIRVSVGILIRPEVLSVLVWFQIVCKSNQREPFIPRSGLMAKIIIRRVQMKLPDLLGTYYGVYGNKHKNILKKEFTLKYGMWKLHVHTSLRSIFCKLTFDFIIERQCFNTT